MCLWLKVKSKTQILRILFLVSGYWFLVTGYCFAEKITILYTGGTHAALYHCGCPVQPDGGVGRRMTKVKELRKGKSQCYSGGCRRIFCRRGVG